jgi:hypothetical protein
MVLVVVRQEGWTALTVAREAENNYRQPRDLLKKKPSDSLKESTCSEDQLHDLLTL